MVLPMIFCTKEKLFCVCIYCGAEFCNTFALMYHVKRCEAHKGKTEPEESK